MARLSELGKISNQAASLTPVKRINVSDQIPRQTTAYESKFQADLTRIPLRAQIEDNERISPIVECQRGSDDLIVQRKMTVSPAKDKYEKEADQVAAQVVAQINATTTSPVFKQRLSNERELLRMPSVQRSADSEKGGEVSDELAAEINRARGTGRPLEQGLQTKISQTTGVDFSRVRVHTNSHSDQMARSIQAKAFTTGKDIFFQQGEYKPTTQRGQELIAHELTHVAQQNRMVLQRQETTQNEGGEHYQSLCHMDQVDGGLRASLTSAQGAIGGTEAIRRAFQVTSIQGGGVQMNDDRPAFRATTKKLLINTAVGNHGEAAVDAYADPDTGSFVMPTLHRRHKVAWKLWREGINQALKEKSIDNLKVIEQLADVYIMGGVDVTLFNGNRNNDLATWGRDIFNQDWNLWIGPGDENIALGASIMGALNSLKSNPEDPTAHQTAKSATYDPRNKTQFTWNQATRAWDQELISDVNLSPASTQAETATEMLLHFLVPSELTYLKKEQAQQESGGFRRINNDFDTPVERFLKDAKELGYWDGRNGVDTGWHQNPWVSSPSIYMEAYKQGYAPGRRWYNGRDDSLRGRLINFQLSNDPDYAGGYNEGEVIKKGREDGANRRPPDQQFFNDPDYLTGYDQGLIWAQGREDRANRRPPDQQFFNDPNYFAGYNNIYP